jgi:four helix bundle protein
VGHGVRRFVDLRAWQACVTYKRAVYRLCEAEPIASDRKRRGQLEDSVSGPPGHVAEGFGRFNPLDFARFVVIARASLMESQNHLLDFVDRGYITEERRLELNLLAERALEETTGLLEYLQSPEALRNARRARERRIATRDARRVPKLEQANIEQANVEQANVEQANVEQANVEQANVERPNKERPNEEHPELRIEPRTRTEK